MQTSTTHQKPGLLIRLPTVMTRKGQITIPAPIREALGIKEGDMISVALEGDAVTLERVSLSLAESYQSIPAVHHAPVILSVKIRPSVQPAFLRASTQLKIGTDSAIQRFVE